MAARRVESNSAEKERDVFLQPSATLKIEALQLALTASAWLRTPGCTQASRNHTLFFQLAATAGRSEDLGTEEIRVRFWELNRTRTRASAPPRKTA